MVLGACTDAVLFISRFGKATKTDLQMGLRKLRDYGARVAGVVLNDVNVRKNGYSYSGAFRDYGHSSYDYNSSRHDDDTTADP